MTGTWYPPTTYEPAAGTGQLLANPPFTVMPDHITAACHDACQAMAKGCAKAVTTGRQSDLQAALAVALDALIAAGIRGSQWLDCAAHLKVAAEQGRVG